MIIQVIKFKSELSEQEVLKVANARADEFRALPGLIQKYYYKTSEPNEYGGVYLWENAENMQAYRKSNLASSIPDSYEITSPPNVDILEVMFPLRD